MGCTRSKTVVPTSPDNGNNGDQGQNSAVQEIQHDQLTSSSSKDAKNKKNRAKSGKIKGPLPPINHTDLLPDIELFSSYQCDSADLAVNNAKPRLNCPGIGRAVRLAPITPGAEQQISRLHTTDSQNVVENGSVQNASKDGFNIHTADHLFHETNGGRVSSSLPTSDSGFSNYRHPPVSVSPRNSFSRTTMKTGLTPDSSGFFSYYGGSEFSPLNTSRSSIYPVSRASSARTGSVLTTGALNTSFMTSVDGEDDLTTENTLELGQLDITDAESEADAGSRAATVTPMLRLSGDPPGGFPAEVGGIGTIVEEYEGGFTPRGPSKDASFNELKPTPENNLPHFTPKEIYEHNDRKGTIDWCMYLGKVYDVSRLKNTFQPILLDIQQTTQDCKSKVNEQIQDSSSDSGSEESYKSNPKSVRWDHRSVYNILQTGIGKDKLYHFLNKCCVGYVVQPDEARFWEDIWSDVGKILDDLMKANAKDTLTAYCAEYMHLLQRWVRKYRQLLPKTPTNTAGKDMNQDKYPLPEEIASNPGVLRKWLDTWVPFDFELPEHGTAWDRVESNDTGETQGDSETYWLPDLQEHPGFDHTITGEAAWETIPENLVADGVMTNMQLQTEASRRHRRDLFNPDSMRRRRSKLMQYFVKKYDYSVERVTPFMEWAETMKKGEEEFMLLCLS